MFRYGTAPQILFRRLSRNECLTKSVIGNTKIGNRNHSSLAALPEIYEDEDYLNLKDTEGHKLSSKRPRLDDLRRKLKIEKSNGFDKSLLLDNAAKENAKTKDSELESSHSWEELLSIAKSSLDRVPSPVETVTDKYKRYHTYLRISLSERCNLRCRYCMPPEGVPLQEHEKILTTSEINKLVNLFATSGIDKVSSDSRSWHEININIW